jgi:hypothetical protein
MASPNPFAAFTGTYGGTTSPTGYNLIYVPTPTGVVLKIQRIREELKFLYQQGLFGVPVNRGDKETITVKPIVYDQYAADNDVSEMAGNNLATGAGVLHQEAGMFLQNSDGTVQRLGTLPHGIAFNMQGTAVDSVGAPVIPAVNTKPYIDGQPSASVLTPQASPADAAKITAAIRTDPSSILRTAIAQQMVVSTTTIELDTHHPTIPGGGVTNSQFTAANAAVVRARSTFWAMKVSGWFGPQDLLAYSQEVLLQIDGVIYPHVTVAALSRDPLPAPIVF